MGENDIDRYWIFIDYRNIVEIWPTAEILFLIVVDIILKYGGNRSEA